MRGDFPEDPANAWLQRRMSITRAATGRAFGGSPPHHAASMMTGLGKVSRTCRYGLQYLRARRPCELYLRSEG